MLNGTLLWYSEPIFDAKMRTPELVCSDALKSPQILACRFTLSLVSGCLLKVQSKN